MIFAQHRMHATSSLSNHQRVKYFQAIRQIGWCLSPFS